MTKHWTWQNTGRDLA